MRSRKIPHPSRRRFLKQGLLAAGVLFGGGGVLSLARERYWTHEVRVTVPLANLPTAFEGFTICQLSDFHSGKYVSEEQISHGLSLAASLKPDLVALTGDYVSGRASNADVYRQTLAELSAPFGVYAVLGNHDYWSGDVAYVRGALGATGVQVLVNQSARITRNGESLWLCGLDDVWSGSPDLSAALRGVPERACKLLLCHEPDFADKAIGRNIALQLSGHTHGGQVRVPGVGALILPYLGKKYPFGLQRVGNSDLQVYTSAGLGVVTPPVRFNCRPEVTLLTLRRVGDHRI